MRTNGHPITRQPSNNTDHRRPTFVSFQSDQGDDTPVFDKGRDRGRARRENKAKHKRFDPREDRDDDWN